MAGDARGFGSRALVIVAAVLVALGGLATAVGAQTAPSTTAPVPTSTRPLGITKTSVRVGGLGWALQYGGADAGAKARFARANAEGGVNGRSIDYVGMRDDGGNPAADAAAVTQLVTQDHVFAVVPAVTPVLAADGLASAKVPYVGWALSTGFCTTGLGFGFSGCQTPPNDAVASGAWGAALAQLVGNGGPQKSALVLSEATDSGTFARRSLAADLAAAGFQVVNSDATLPVPSVGDYGAIAGKVMVAAAGHAPDVVVAVGAYSNVLLARTALAAAGFAGVFSDALEYDPQLVASAQGAAVFLQTAPVESASSTPGMQHLVDDVHKYAPGQTIDPSVIAGYLSADFFLQVLAKQPKNPTPASFARTAAGFTYSLNGVVGPTRFPTAQTQPIPCGSLVQSNGNAYTVKVAYACAKKVVPVP
jgi:ABC-type branched-subunit amino acid transport system substrate-binding protein